MTVAKEKYPADPLSRIGLPRDAVLAWLNCDGVIDGDYRRAAENFSRQWRLGAELIALLPAKPSRSEAQHVAAVSIFERDRAAREKFLDAYTETIYRRLTDDFAKFKRVEDLVR